MSTPDLTFDSATRLLEAMGARLTVGVSAPFLADRELQRDPAHARCTSHVAARLERDGWQTASEVEVGGDRSRGWIDILAYHPDHRLLLVIEIKTEIRDLGAIERTLGWHERESWVAARRLGWRPRKVVGCLFLLATEMNEDRISDNRAAFSAGFPIGATELRRIMSNDAPPNGARAMALIDPRSRRQQWLRPSRLDGRPTPAPMSTTPTSCASSTCDGDHLTGDGWGDEPSQTTASAAPRGSRLRPPASAAPLGRWRSGQRAAR